jgi:tetratricopeptide (TPR) repeat protein
MTRPIARPDPRPIAFAAALALLPLGLVACGKDKTPPKPVVAVATSTPAAEPKVIPAGGLPPTEKTTPPASLLTSFADAETAYHEGRVDEAKRYFEEYVASKPDNPWGFYMLGLAAARTGDLAEAEKALEKSLELEPKSVKTHRNLTRVLLDLGRDNEALEESEVALTLDSTSAESFRLKARAQAKLGDPASAIETYREALVVDDKDVWSMNNLGLIYLEQGRPDDALGPLARAVELKGTAPVFQNNLGMALERAGFPVAAKEAYERAVKADSTYTKAVKNLERIGGVVGDTTGDAGVNLSEMAEVFRLNVQMWKDSKGKPPVEETPMIRDSVPDIAVPDTTGR